MRACKRAKISVAIPQYVDHEPTRGRRRSCVRERRQFVHTAGGSARHHADRGGEPQARTIAEVLDKLGRCLVERHGDVLLMAGMFSANLHNQGFQSTYVARMKTSYPDYVCIGVMEARRHIVVA